ncbi:hypothetical protein ACFSVJ_26410 [Prauserella oleivorans]
MTTTTADLPAPATPPDGQRPRGTRVPARLQIMAWLVLVMTAGLATVVLLVAEFEYGAIDRRVNSGLEQDVEEFRLLARSGATRRPGSRCAIRTNCSAGT